MKTDRKRQIAWDEIEKSFRAGKSSGRQIAKQHRISEGAIRKRAKAGNWVRPPGPEKKKTAGPITAPIPTGLTAQQLAQQDVDRLAAWAEQQRRSDEWMKTMPQTDYGAIVDGLRALKQRKEAASCSN